jgi:hypothetical protein
VAVGALLAGAALLLFSMPASIGLVNAAADAVLCAKAGHASCDRSGILSVTLLALFGPALALVGAVLASAALAVLLRPRGRMDAEGRRLLEDAKRYFMTGTLSPEAFQATRERLHARAESSVSPQCSLALGLLAALAALVTGFLGLGVLAMLVRLSEVPASLPMLRVGAGLAGLSVLGMAGLVGRAWQASRRWARRSRQEANDVSAMLRELEFDVLDEVRRSPRIGPAASASPAAQPDAAAWRPAP